MRQRQGNIKMHVTIGRYCRPFSFVQIHSAQKLLFFVAAGNVISHDKNALFFQAAADLPVQFPFAFRQEMMQALKGYDGIPFAIAKLILKVILTYCGERFVMMFCKQFGQHISTQIHPCHFNLRIYLPDLIQFQAGSAPQV